jgi:hypothetical protein
MIAREFFSRGPRKRAHGRRDEWEAGTHDCAAAHVVSDSSNCDGSVDIIQPQVPPRCLFSPSLNGSPRRRHGMAWHSIAQAACLSGAPQVHNHERQPHATGDRPGTAIHFRSERHQTSVRGQSLSLAAEPCPQCHAWSPNAVSHLAVRRQLTPVWPAAPTVRMNCVWNTSGLHRRHRSNGCNLNFLICASG